MLVTSAERRRSRVGYIFPKTFRYLKKLPCWNLCGSSSVAGVAGTEFGRHSGSSRGPLEFGGRGGAAASIVITLSTVKKYKVKRYF